MSENNIALVSRCMDILCDHDAFCQELFLIYGRFSFIER